MTSPAVELLQAKQDQQESELMKLEKQLYELETQYLQADYCQCGTVLKGFEGFLSSKDTLRKRNRQFKLEDRSLSLSSKTSPATTELEQQALETMVETNGMAPGKGKAIFAQKGIAMKGRR